MTWEDRQATHESNSILRSKIESSKKKKNNAGLIIGNACFDH